MKKKTMTEQITIGIVIYESRGDGRTQTFARVLQIVLSTKYIHMHIYQDCFLK